MANKKSLPTRYGNELVSFSVGDGCHWGYNGDAYPGTVVRVSVSGRKVWVSPDDYKPKPGQAPKQLGDVVEYEFETVERPENELKCYTRRKSGYFQQAGCDGFDPWHLKPGRAFRWNPSF